MMDLVKQETPLVNKDIVNGYATIKLKDAPIYIDNIFKWAFGSLKKLCDLRYESYEICTPREEFAYSSRPRSGNGIKRSNSRSVNIGESSVYMLKYYFTYKGEKLDPLYLYLPFCEEAGLNMLGGTRRFIFPVLANKIISSTKEGIFIKILKDKKNFSRMNYHIYVDEQLSQFGIILSPLYDKTARQTRMSDTTAALTTCVHYILSKYGYSGFWQKFYGFVPFIGYMEDVQRTYGTNEEYVIVRGTGIKPKSYKDDDYVPTSLAFAIRKDQTTNDVLSTIATMFYIIDNFPNMFQLNHIENNYIWKMTLAYINFSSQFKEQDLFGKMDEHLASIEDMTNLLLKHKLQEIGYECDDIYDLLFFIKRDFAKWHTSGEFISSMYGKELDVLDHTLSRMVKSIFRASYEVKKKMSSKKELTKSEITEILRKTIPLGDVFKIFDTRDGTRSNASDVNYSGDNKFFKITSTIIPQERKRNKHGGGATSEKDPNIKLHASYAECGGYLAIAKREPIGNGGINPYATLDEYGTLLQRPEFKEMLDDAQRKINNLG